MQFRKEDFIGRARHFATTSLETLRGFKGPLHVKKYADYQDDLLNSALEAFLRTVTENYPLEASVPKAEETAVIIKRILPGTYVTATCQYITLSLPNSKFRIYRETSGFRPGSYRITAPWIGEPQVTGLSSLELAEYLIAFDQAVPELHQILDSFFEGINAELLRHQANEKALAIEDKAVKTLLEELLLPMDVACSYEIDDGVVRLTLSRKYTGKVDIPVQNLAAFLTDREAVEKTLKVSPAEKPCHIVRPQPIGPLFHGNIISNP